jgi:hypothetical protein
VTDTPIQLATVAATIARGVIEACIEDGYLQFGNE